MAELGRRMTARELYEWRVFYSMEAKDRAKSMEPKGQTMEETKAKFKALAERQKG